MALGATPLLAVTTMLNGDPVALGGVPDITPVTVSMVSHAGMPVALNVGAGYPVAVNPWLYGTPTAATAGGAGPVNAGAMFTPSVKFCTASGGTPLDAVTVSG